MLETYLIDINVLEAVVVTDNGVFIAAGNAYEVESNDLLDTIGMEVILRKLAPDIIACENAVT